MVPQPDVGRRAERIVDDGVRIGWKVIIDRLDILDGARESATGAGAEAGRAAARWETVGSAAGRGGYGHDWKISRWLLMRYDSYGRSGVAGALNYSRMSGRGRRPGPEAAGSQGAGGYTSAPPEVPAAGKPRADRVAYSDSWARRRATREAPVGGE